jgi:hypothetical protein
MSNDREDLGEVFAVLWRRKWLILAAAVLARLRAELSLIRSQLLAPAAQRRPSQQEGASQVAVQPATTRSVGSSRMAAAR